MKRIKKRNQEQQNAGDVNRQGSGKDSRTQRGTSSREDQQNLGGKSGSQQGQNLGRKENTGEIEDENLNRKGGSSTERRGNESQGI